MICQVHPKYRGKKQPKLCNNKDCICPKIYLEMHRKPRTLPMPTKIIKDKTKYYRKKKHKNKDQ